jgi:hypothetical protein
MTEAHNTLTKANEIPLNREVENSTSVEELRHYIQFLHSAIPTLHKNQEMLWAFGEKMVERVKTEKEKFRSQNQNFSKLTATHSEILELYQEEQEVCEDQRKLITQLSLDCRKLKKKKIELKAYNGDLIAENFGKSAFISHITAEHKELKAELQTRLDDEISENHELYEKIEKMEQENAELKEKLKHYLPWYERAKMEETEKNDDN